MLPARAFRRCSALASHLPRGLHPGQHGVQHRSLATAAAAADGWSVQAFTGGGGTTRSGLNRVGFTLQFETADLDQYLKDHEEVWPEMQQALVDCGWHNYSLFYRPGAQPVTSGASGIDGSDWTSRSLIHLSPPPPRPRWTTHARPERIAGRRLCLRLLRDRRRL